MVVQIMSNGATLRVKDGVFEILIPQPPDGTTYQKHEYAVSHIESIWVHSAASVTTAAIRLALENDIDFVVCDWRGMPLGRFTPHRPNTTASVQKAQLIISQTPHAITYVKEWIGLKLSNQIAFLLEIAQRRKADAQKICKTAVKQIEALLDKIQALEGQHISEIADVLRGMEGSACRVYFDALNHILPKYYQFDGRSRQPAADLFNAFLNYGYAILYNRVEKAVTMAGLNPFVGYLHRDDFGGFRSFVFDVIEPFRIEVDKLVFKLFAGKQVSYEQHGMAPPQLKDTADGTWLSESGRKLIAARFIDSYDNWHTRLATFTRHIAASMRKQLSARDLDDRMQTPMVALHFFQ